MYVFLITAILAGMKWYFTVVFDLHFPFHVYIDHLYNFFGGMSIQSICSF